MNLFAYDGRLAKAPVLTRPNGATVCKFTLIRNEYRGVDDAGVKREERKVAVPFTAFDAQAEAIAKHAMQGDQLIVRARVENNDYENRFGGIEAPANPPDWRATSCLLAPTCCTASHHVPVRLTHPGAPNAARWRPGAAANGNAADTEVLRRGSKERGSTLP
jgi:single-strand DNA-binding protein